MFPDSMVHCIGIIHNLPAYKTVFSYQIRLSENNGQHLLSEQNSPYLLPVQKASHTIWYIAVYQIISGILGGVLAGFAFVTLLFAFLYKKGIKIEGLSDGIDNLPPVPQKTNRISKADAIIGIIFSVIFTIIFLVCPQIICIAFVKNGVGVYEPLFNLEYIRQTWYLILAFGIRPCKG